MSDFLNKFGNRLKYFRQLRGFSQEKLGEMADVATKTVSEWETGKSFIEYPTLVRLCQALRIEEAQLFYFPPQNNSELNQTIDVSNLSQQQISILNNIISEFRK